MFRIFRSPSRFDYLLFRKRYPVLYPRYFDDPLAMRTRWVPMSLGGYRRTLHLLCVIAPGVHSFQSTAYRHYQTLVCLGSLLVFDNLLIMSLLRNELSITRHEHWWVILLLGQILVVGCVTLFLLNRPIVID